VACGVSVIVAVLSGQIAARRAARTSPVQALRETAAEVRWPSPVRILLGLVAAGGAGTLMAFTFGQKSAAGQLALAFPLLLTCMVAVALLGPVLVAFAAWLARPARAVAGPSARLALAAISAQPRRTASAVIPVALAVAMVGSVYFADASIAHATAAQAGSTVTADRVISGSGPGSGLDTGALRQVRALPGVRAAAGVAPLSVAAAAAAQDGFANNLILGLVAALAAVALVNTLAVATVERRRALRLLGRVGASRGQVAAAFGWHALFVTVTGVVAGVAAGAVTLVAVSRAATGSWVPFIPLAPAAGLVLAVAGLVAGAVMIPFYLMSRREPALPAG
jgi:putative ABC transport system permease protein